VTSQLDASTVVRADDHGLLCCHVCGKLTPLASAAACVRCGVRLFRRRPNSVQITWALLICSVLLYLPSNLYPILSLVQFGNGEPQTIWGGTVMMWEEGYKGIAIIIFVASLVVPTAKIIGLTVLLIAVQLKQRWHPRVRTHMYHVIEVIGRWSMLDLFVISIMTALVRLGYPATVEPFLGATFFGAVVILTMLAAMSFDPRLIWDDEPHAR
jgi:paraquat-inducible protein A